MAKWKKLSHTIYQCKYHIVWCPKYRYRILKGVVAEFVEQTIRMLCEWRNRDTGNECKRGSYTYDTFYTPRLSISEVMGMLKGKTAIKLFKSFPTLKKKPYWGNHFWSQGYCVSSIGLDENKIRKYVKYQEEKERQEEGDQQEFGLF